MFKRDIKIDFKNGNLIEETEFVVGDLDESGIIRDKNGLPRNLPHSRLKMERIEARGWNHYMYTVPALHDTVVKVWENTPENKAIAKKEAFIMNKLSQVGLCARIYFCIFKDDYIYMMYERQRGRDITAAWGKYVPSHVFKSIKKMAWLAYNAGIEFHEIVPENFIIINGYQIQFSNFEKARVINDIENYKMDDYLHEFLFSDLETWNPYYHLAVYDETTDREDFDRLYGYVPEDLRNYAKHMWQIDSYRMNKQLQEGTIKDVSEFQSGMALASDYNFSLRGPFEHITLPKVDMYNDKSKNKFYNSNLNAVYMTPEIEKKYSKDYVNKLVRYKETTPIYDHNDQLGREIKELTKPPKPETKFVMPRYDGSDRIPDYVKNRNDSKYSKTTFNKYMKACDSDNESDNSEGLSEEIKKFQKLLESIQNGTYELDSDSESESDNDDIIEQQIKLRKELDQIKKDHNTKQKELQKEKKEIENKIKNQEKNQVKTTKKEVNKEAKPKVPRKKKE